MESTKELKEMVLEEVTQYLREKMVATFEKADEETLVIRFVGGRTLTLRVSENN